MSKAAALFAMALPLAAIGCGSADVSLAPARPAASAGEAADDIATAATRGSQLATLFPASRITVRPVAPQGGAAAGSRQAAPSAAGAGGGAAANPTVQEATGRDGRRYAVSVTPDPGETPTTVRVTPRNDVFSKNQLTIAYFGDTTIPRTVTNEFTDLTILRIQQVGAVAQALATLAAGAAAPPLTQPSALRPPAPASCRLEPFSIRATGLGEPEMWRDLPGQQPGCFEYAVAAADGPPVETVSRAWFLRAFVAGAQASGDPAPAHAAVWPVPACREATLRVRRVGKTELELTVPVVVADDTWMRLFAIPEKGAITMGPACGASLTNTQGDRDGMILQAIEEAIKQARAVQKAAAGK